MQYFNIGKLAASHGLDGTLILIHNLGQKSNFKNLEVLFIQESPNNFMPYFLEECTAKSDTEVYIKLEGISSKEAARKLTPKEVWMAAADFEKQVAKNTTLSLLGFQLYDGQVCLGEIIEVIEQPHQILCCIQYKGNEAMIPVHNHNLVKMDAKNKKLYVTVPDGLLDIYGEE